MNDSVFLDSAAFFSASGSVWRAAQARQRPHSRRPDAMTAICSLSASAQRRLGPPFMPHFAQRIRTGASSRCSASRRRSGRSQKALQVDIFLRHGRAASRPPPARGWSTAAQDLRCVYTQELASGAAAGRGGRHPAPIPAPGNADRHGAAGSAATPKACEMLLACLLDSETNPHKKCVSFKMVLDFMTNFDYNVQADNLK